MEITSRAQILKLGSFQLHPYPCPDLLATFIPDTYGTPATSEPCKLAWSQETCSEARKTLGWVRTKSRLGPPPAKPYGTAECGRYYCLSEALLRSPLSLVSSSPLVPSRLFVISSRLPARTFPSSSHPERSVAFPSRRFRPVTHRFHALSTIHRRVPRDARRRGTFASATRRPHRDQSLFQLGPPTYYLDAQLQPLEASRRACLTKWDGVKVTAASRSLPPPHLCSVPASHLLRTWRPFDGHTHGVASARCGGPYSAASRRTIPRVRPLPLANAEERTPIPSLLG